jgi:hypothetical protein
MKILFYKINECGRLEQSKQTACSIVITENNLDEIMSIIEASGMQLYNGTNKIYSESKDIRKYLKKKLKPNEKRGKNNTRSKN